MRRAVEEFPHSQFPVCEDTLDNVLGSSHVKDLLAGGPLRQPFEIRGILRVPLFLYAGATEACNVLETFKGTGTRIAIVLDEYGSVQGLLTPSDILEAIVGDMPTENEVGDGRHPSTGWLLVA